MKLIEIEPFILRFDGQREFLFEDYKTVEIDGETYHKTKRELKTIDYSEAYNNGKMNKVEINNFSFILGSNITVYYYDESDFEYTVRKCIQSHLGNMMTCVAEYYGFECSWGKGNDYHRLSEWDVKINSFPIIIESYYSNNFTLYLPYQDFVKYDLLGHMFKLISGSYRIPTRIKSLFSHPNKTDNDRLQNLIRFNECLFDYSELEDDLL